MPVILAALLGWWGYATYLQVDTKYDFTSSACSNDGLHTKPYIEQARWENRRLIVDVVNSTNCGTPFASEAILKGDTLKLRVHLEKDNNAPPAKCSCTQRSSFTFKHMEKKEYQIDLTDSAGIAGKLSLHTDNSIADGCDQTPEYECYFPYNATAVKPGASALEFNYNGEKVIFDAGKILFVARAHPELPFRFMPAMPAANAMSQPQLMLYAQWADRAYKAMQGIDGFDTMHFNGTVDITPKPKTAIFNGSITPAAKTAAPIIVHGRSMPDTKPVNKSLRINLATNGITEIN